MAARRNVSLPEDLDEAARAAGLNVSGLTRQAIVDALDRENRMSRLDAWLDELDAEHGPPSAEAVIEAEAWVASAAPVGAEKKPGLISGPASEAIARRARTVASKAKSGTVKSTRVSARTAKTTSKSVVSQPGVRTRRAKR